MEKEDLYRMWWLHDARWYQEVAKEAGFEAANRINSNALSYVAHRVAKSTLASIESPVNSFSLEQKIELFCQNSLEMWPEEMLEYSYEITGEDTFEVSLIKNFALIMLGKAKTLDRYECPCLALRQSWFDGLGIKVAENTKIQCMKDGAECCKLHAKIEN